MSQKAKPPFDGDETDSSLSIPTLYSIALTHPQEEARRRAADLLRDLHGIDVERMRSGDQPLHPDLIAAGLSNTGEPPTRRSAEPTRRDLTNELLWQMFVKSAPNLPCGVLAFFAALPLLCCGLMFTIATITSALQTMRLNSDGVIVQGTVIEVTSRLISSTRGRSNYAYTLEYTYTYDGRRYQAQEDIDQGAAAALSAGAGINVRVSQSTSAVARYAPEPDARLSNVPTILNGLVAAAFVGGGAWLLAMGLTNLRLQRPEGKPKHD